MSKPVLSYINWYALGPPVLDKGENRWKKINHLSSWFFVSQVADHRPCSCPKAPIIPMLAWTSTNMNPSSDKQIREKNVERLFYLRNNSWDDEHQEEGL